MVEANPNEYSCVLYVQLNRAQPYRNFLIMGDAGWPTEYELMKKYPELQVDVLGSVENYRELIKLAHN